MRKSPKKRSKSLPKSACEELLLSQIRAAMLPEPRRQYRAIEGRRFAHDFAWPEYRLLVEVQGAVFTIGAHSTGLGITRDCEKLSLAVARGWRQLNATSAQVKSGQAIEWIKQAILSTSHVCTLQS